MIRMRGRKYRLDERVLDRQPGFCPLFYVSALNNQVTKIGIL